MSERCDPIEEKLDEHIKSHHQDHKEDIVCVQEIKSDIKMLTHKFDDYLEENKEYRRLRKEDDEAWRKEMSPILDGWKSLKWVFGTFLALGGALLLAKNLFMK